MDLWDIARAQAMDPFRVGLIVALVATTLRTEAVTGRLVPLLAGVLFVAAVIPMTTARGLVPLGPAVAVGVGVNALLLAGVLLVRRVLLRWTR